MRDRESLSLCPMLPFMKKKNFVPSPSKVFGHLPSSTFLPDFSLLLLNMDPIHKVHSASFLPLTLFSTGPSHSPSNVIIRATGHRGREPEFYS